MPERPPKAKRPLSLWVIFLTLFIDLVGFSIIFPLGPNLIEYYLKVDGQSGLLGWLLGESEHLARAVGQQHAFAAVLFGGVMTSFYSILQFICAPLWGSLSDRRGRRGVLLMTVAGTALGYVLWFVSGSFWLFLLSRIVSGGFSGNLSVITAAVADVTSREERSRAMGLVGAAFGLGLIMGPGIGAISGAWNLLAHHPGLARFGVNPFSVPALLSLVFCVVNYFWIRRSFKETLPESVRQRPAEKRIRNPLRAILLLDNAEVRRANVVAFVYSMAFVSMESCLTFLAAERFAYGEAQNGELLVFLGLVAVLVQGVLVRRILKSADEIPVLGAGLVLSAIGLAAIGVAGHPWLLYAGLAVLATGSGFVNPATSGLISLYASASEQGRVLGIFRSLGSLSRAITPLLAGVVFWAAGSKTVFLAAAVLALIALALSLRLPKPAK
ncbi:MAG TPA: MFS transporter [Opitutaceae bacterium]|nr:MFS transporter [Opitutaceae bacterium]